jgi:hypothetical protein
MTHSFLFEKAAQNDQTLQKQPPELQTHCKHVQHSLLGKATAVSKKKKVPEIPMSYPNMRPLEAATMHMITTETVILPLKPLLGPSTAKPPIAIFSIPAPFSLLEVINTEALSSSSLSERSNL